MNHQVYFRLTINSYMTKNNQLVEKKTLTPLKRKSCDCCIDGAIEELASSVDHGGLIIYPETEGVYTIQFKTSKGYFDTYEEVNTIYFETPELLETKDDL